MKKKFLALALASVMVFSLTACGSKGNDKSKTPTEAPATESADATDNANATDEANQTDNANETEDANSGDEVENVTPAGQIIIGNYTETSGDYTPFWSNGAADYDVYKMVAGTSVVSMTKDEDYVFEERVVDDVQVTDNEDGSKTYTFTLKPDLKWSNGEPITAKDYVFYYMFLGSDEAITGLEASLAVDEKSKYVKGFEDYSAGKTDVFEGVHLISDTQYSITIDAKHLPFFYGNALLESFPMYMAGWVPADVTIEETENGAKFSDNYKVEYIKDTVEAMRYKPVACSGPYMLESYDTGSYSYTLKANPEYVGNFEGKKANIETIIYKYVSQNTMMDEIKTGSIDILLQVADGPLINAGLDLVDAGTHGYISYPRNGYGQLIFKCNVGPTQFVEVRQAVAYLLDRNEFAKNFTGGHGTIVHGPYGASQWMVEEAEEQIGTLNTYSKDPKKAIEVLEAGGWTLDKDGKEYSGTGLRYKEVDGKLMPLKIEWCSSEGNSVSDALVSMLSSSKDVADAGMEIVQNVVTFQVLLDEYYSKNSKYHMFNMGEGFSVPYDVKEQYAINGAGNNNQLNDEELAKYAEDMNKVTEGDDETYLETWFNFIKKWNELLPNVPLYSNEYHDFYTNRVKGYDFKNDIWDIAKAVIYASVED